MFRNISYLPKALNTCNVYNRGEKTNESLFFFILTEYYTHILCFFKSIILVFELIHFYLTLLLLSFYSFSFKTLLLN